MANVIIMAVLALVSSVESLTTLLNETTYERRLSSGQKVLCDRCAPGFHLYAHCTKTRRTVCQPCDEGFYTEYWNYMLDCLPCNFCSSEQVTRRQCSSSQNSVCECREGYYWNTHYCKRHTQCPAGHGIKEKGTPFKDTICERCLNGHFSPKNRGSFCLPHTPCKPEEKLLLNGTDRFDNVCATCNDLTGKGWVKLIKPVLIKTFNHHKSQQLRRLVKSQLRILLKKSQQSQIIRFRTPLPKKRFLQQVHLWLDNITADQLMKLPNILAEDGLTGLAASVEQKINRIQEEIKKCSETIIYF